MYYVEVEIDFNKFQCENFEKKALLGCTESRFIEFGAGTSIIDIFEKSLKIGKNTIKIHYEKENDIDVRGFNRITFSAIVDNTLEEITNCFYILSRQWNRLIFNSRVFEVTGGIKKYDIGFIDRDTHSVIPGVIEWIYPEKISTEREMAPVYILSKHLTFENAKE